MPRVLVVEKDAAMRGLMEIMFSGAGNEVTSVETSAHAGAELALGGRRDWIIKGSDSGNDPGSCDLLKHLEKTPGHRPVSGVVIATFLPGYAQEEIAKLGLKAVRPEISGKDPAALKTLARKITLG
ncbi:MAG: response regulator [Alphaproteobacteria bacterium]